METTALSVGKSVINGAISYAKSAIAEEIALQLGVRRDQAFITDELESMQSFLMAAHEEQDEHRVLNTWVKQVRNVSYDVEDCLMDSSLHLRKPSWWRLRTLRERHRIAKEMKELRARVEDVSQRNLRYHLIKGSSSKPPAAAEQSSITAAAKFGGVDEAWRTNAKEESQKVDLVKLITKVDRNVDLGVIVVWGSNGDLGNTSIIRVAYDSEDVKAKFPCRAWVRLVRPFNPLEFLQSLLRQFYEKEEIEKGQKDETNVGLEVFKKMQAQCNLADEVNRFMTTERYLVVITDLSTVEDWDWIKTYFPNKNGSRIILSTLQIDVPSLCIKRPYKVSEIQQFLFDDEFYVFYKEEDSSKRKDEKPECSSSAAANSTAVAVDESVSSADEILHDSDGKSPTAIPSAGMKKDYLIEREEAKSKLIPLIKSEHGCQVISVWGLGGIGKTTFVRSIYQSNKDLDGRFERRAWINPSRPFSQVEFLIKGLVQQLVKKDQDDNIEKQRTARSKQADKQNKLEETDAEILKKILKDNRCLIVVDDLSSNVEWDRMKRLLLPEANNPANRIIVTTRKLSVAKHCSSEEKCRYNLLNLNEVAACKLFRNKVFKDNEQEISKFLGNPDMIGQEKLILDKCGGLPLAISTIGSFLATRPKTVMEWRNLNMHISTELAMNPEFDRIKTTLASCYDGLPYYLKSSFLYMSVFPEDHQIRSARLVRRWIAEGYSRGMHNSTEEQTGNSYINELINRSLVQTSNGREGLSYYSGRFGLLNVHDLIREIGISKSTEENLVFTLGEGCSLSAQGTVRHLAISSSWKRDKDAFRSALDASRLRSLTVFGDWKSFLLSDKMRFLRVLDLEDTTGLRNHDLHQIGKLLHLRYLSLRRCEGILRLPNSLGNLRQLQTLDIRDTLIIKLPKAVIKLRKLQYLRGGFVPGDEDTQDGKSWWSCDSDNRGMGRGRPRVTCCCVCYGVSCGLPCYLLAGCGFLLFVMGWLARILLRDGVDGLPVHLRRIDPHGVKVPKGIRKLKELHTLGVVNVARGKAVFKELRELTQLRNLKVTGINKKNCKDFYSAIAKHECLECLSVRSEGQQDLCDRSDIASPPPPESLQRLKLYGYLVNLPTWIERRQNLVKLTLRSSRISDHNAAMLVLGDLPNLAVLRLLEKSFQGQELCFSFQQEKFPSLTVVGLDYPGDLKSVKFEQGASPKLEVIKFRGGSYCTRAGLFSGLESLPSLKEFMLGNGNYEEEFLKDVQDQLAGNTKGPVLKRC